MGFLVKIITFCFLIFVSSQAVSMPEVKLVTFKPTIEEVIASYPPAGNSRSNSIEPTIVIPYQKTFSQFGGMTSDNAFVAKETLNKVKVSPICGASPELNTMNCYDLKGYGQYLSSYPIPGSISSTPVFYEGSWLFGTSKGFLMRVEGNAENKYLPKLGDKNIELWGSASRRVMASFRPKAKYTISQDIKAEPNSVENAQLPVGIKWIFPTSSEFIGTPIISNGLIHAISANDYYQVLDWNTGKLNCAIRLSPESNLRLSTYSMSLTDSEIIVGTNFGNVLALKQQDCSVLWSLQIPMATDEQRLQTKLAAGPDRFSGIVSPVLVTGRDIIVSNAESLTQKISLDTQKVIWNYPLGSVTQAKLYNNSLILGSSNGKVVNLDSQTGHEIWTTSVSDTSPIVSLAISKYKVILAATLRGRIYLIHPDTGMIFDETFPLGEVNGTFFSGYGESEFCLSFSQNGFRCFQVKGFK